MFKNKEGKMRKLFAIFIALAVVGMLCFSQVPSTQAQARYGLFTYGPYTILSTNDAGSTAAGTHLITTDPVWIYGWMIFSEAGSSYAGIKDCDTVAELNDHSTYPLDDEIGEATQYDSETKWFPKPMYFSEGLGLALSAGTVLIYYGPEPA
jgi:hypothetical protein